MIGVDRDDQRIWSVVRLGHNHEHHDHFQILWVPIRIEIGYCKKGILDLQKAVQWTKFLRIDPLAETDEEQFQSQTIKDFEKGARDNFNSTQPLQSNSTGCTTNEHVIKTLLI